MSLTNTKIKSQGFTIVELLIVVVVIAILAAITIVSYNGITNRANASAAASAAENVQKKAEAYNAETATYPSALTDLTGAGSSTSYYIAAGSINNDTVANLSNSNGKNTINYKRCTTNGAIITYWAFSGTSTKTVNIGDTTTCP